MAVEIHDKEDYEKEANLNDFRLALGLSIKELCKKIDIPIHDYIALNNGTKSPVYEYPHPNEGEPKRAVRELSKFMGVDLADLFPRYWCKINYDDLVPEQYHLLTASQTDHINEIEAKDLIYTAFMKCLTAREEYVIVARHFHERTFIEIARDKNVVRERVRQIEAKAMRKLKKYIRDMP